MSYVHRFIHVVVALLDSFHKWRRETELGIDALERERERGI